MGLSITGGFFKGHKLWTDKHSTKVRPTSSKVRQALFNTLATRVAGSAFADLYAGSGSVGLEAYSRGAREVVLVEKDVRSFEGLKANCTLLRERNPDMGVLRTVKSDAAELGAKTDFAGYFDIVFADPPFQDDFSRLWDKVRPLVAEGGCAVLQFPSRIRPLWLAEAHSIREYGESGLAYFHLG